jgi:hypothetical protein
MKKLLIVLLAFSIGIANAQFSDPFTDGNFTDDPVWTGDAALFEVNGSGQLHLAATSADTAFLSTPNALISKTEWSFWLKMSFNTSANNHARIYLVSDQEDLEGPLEGYFLQAGGSSDSVVVFRQQGSLLTRLFTCPGLFTGRSVNMIRFIITRDETGSWEILADSTGGMNYRSEGSFHDDLIGSTTFFGIWCRFTSSNGSKFYFDDLRAEPVVNDTIPPVLDVTELTGDDSLRLVFSELLDPLSVLPGNFRVRSSGALPVTALLDPSDGSAVLLDFATPFPEQACDSVDITGIRDLKGNLMSDTCGSFCHYHARSFDVVINEILADPEPSAGLPASEFMELFNRTDHPVQLNNWTLLFGSYCKVFPDVTIPPSGYLILSADTGYLQFGDMAELFTSDYSLPNEEAWLVLKDDRNSVIHSVHYSVHWFGGSFKAEGGWSLEMADPRNPCGCGGNWMPSTDPSGGTPGRVNSVYGPNPDTVPPRLLRAAITGNDRFTVWFSESMDSLSLEGSGEWRINDTLVGVQDVIRIPPDYSTVEIRRVAGFTRGVTYEIKPPADAADCSGNPVPAESQVMAAIPETPGPGDIVINEILADPWPDGSRFIEIYNRSGMIFDLKDILLSYTPADSGSSSVTQGSVSATPFLLMPFDYGVICGEAEDVVLRYGSPFPERFLAPVSFPSLSKAGGRISLQRGSDAEIIDLVDYSEGMHHPLLSSTEGISLERVNPDRPSQEVSNWHSAASSAGYATPGERNSQWWTEPDGGSGEVTLEPLVFSPDNDGKDDLLHILCRPAGSGFLATVMVFDSRGRQIRQVAGNELIAAEGVFTWDGFTDDRTLATAGIYIIYLELVKPDGTVKKYKRTASVAVRF